MQYPVVFSCETLGDTEQIMRMAYSEILGCTNSFVQGAFILPEALLLLAMHIYILNTRALAVFFTVVIDTLGYLRGMFFGLN